MISSSATVSEIASGKTAYATDGFAVMRSVCTPEDVTELRALIAPLFTNFASKTGSRIRDVGAIGDIKPGEQQPEIDRATRLEPKLFKTAAFLKLKSLASEILRTNAKYVFDHAILKMPHTQTSTTWHQDRGYMKGNTSLETVNFWIPLQPVSEENGTLNYIPESHIAGDLPHSTSADLHPHVRTAKVAPKRVVTPSLELGDICFHHPLTVHSAGPNRTDRERLAWSVHFGAYGRFEYLMPRNLTRLVASKFLSS